MIPQVSHPHQLRLFHILSSSHLPCRTSGLPESWETLSLADFTKLETLTFSFDYDNTQPTWVNLEVVRTAVRLYAHLLNAPALRTLRTVTFQLFHATATVSSLRRSAETALNAPWWAALDDVLGGLADATVRFMLCDVPDKCAEAVVREELTGFVETHMPKVREHGRVRVVLEQEEWGMGTWYGTPLP